MTTTSIAYQGRQFTVEPTGIEAAPYRLVGARGGTLELVAHAHNRGLYFVRTSSGKLDGGFVGRLADGSLLWLPSSGSLAGSHQRIWRANRAGARVAEAA